MPSTFRFSIRKFLVLFSVVLAAAFAAGQTPAFTSFDAPDSDSATHPVSINTNGLITGWYFNTVSGAHGFLRLGDGQLIEFDPPGFTSTFPRSINAAGWIVGSSSSHGVSHAFIRLAGGSFHLVDFPGAINSLASSISDSGNLVGYYYDGVTQTHGYLRDAGGNYTTIDAPDATNGSQPQAVNDNGEVVGVYYANGSYHGYFRDSVGNITEFDPPGGTVSNLPPMTINASGEVEGSYFDSSFVTHGFIRDSAGNFTSIDVPGASNSWASSINDAGEVVGYANKLNISSPKVVGFKRSASGRISILATPVESATPSALNSKGRITGQYQDANGIVHGYVQ